MLDLVPDEPNGLCQLLNIQLGPRLKCHGLTKKNSKCTNKISAANSETISTLLDKVIARGNLATAQNLLAELSQLLLCQKNHQEQGKQLLAQWEEAFAEAEKRNADSIATVKSEEEPEQRQIKDEEDNSDVKADCTAVVDENFQELPLFGITDSARCPRNTSSMAIPLRRNRKQRETASPSEQRSSAVPLQHTFEPFGPSRSIRDINAAIKQKLHKPLRSSEIGSSGFIYAYTFPDNYRDAQPYWKIGYTNDIERRKSEWQRQCRYEPTVMCNYRAELHVRVEKLIHLQLHNSRKRERQCPQCSKSHIEWFDVRSSKVGEIVGLWTDWTRQVPYDENGVLKKEWKEKLKSVDLSNPRCWQDLVNGSHGGVTG